MLTAVRRQTYDDRGFPHLFRAREQSVGSFGERLRREREMRGISLDEIAAATKISARNLRALEDEKFNQLPGGIFNKGFVRAYAKFLGIDQEQIVAEYEAASQETEVAREQKLKDEFSKAEFRKQKKNDDQEISLEPKSQWGTIAVIVLIAALAYGGYSFYQRRKLDKLQQAQSPAAVSQPPATMPTAPEPTVTAPNAQPTPAAGTQMGQTPAASTTPAKTDTATAPVKIEPAKVDTAKAASQKTESPVSATPTSATDPKLSSATGTAFDLKIKVNKQ